MTISSPHRSRWRGLLLLALLTLSACGKSTPPSRDPLPADRSSAPPVARVAPQVTVAAPLDAAHDGGDPQPPRVPAAADTLPDPGAPAATADAGATAQIVADNKVDPTEGTELQERAKGLFQAIVTDDTDQAEAFWFPREPFLPLKDMKDPGKYWVELHHRYENDIHALHKKRKRWGGAEFVRFDGGSRSKWVAPGHEANKVGYHRAFDGQLRYKIGGEEAAIEVHTLITWQGRWYVTHLRRVKR
jgi:hypothetical protein